MEVADKVRTMRYFFHVVGNGGSYPDECGMDFAANEDALARGAVLAQEMAYDGSLNGFSVSITNESGDEIGRIPIKSAGSNP
jgi:imidazole glycerol phosphate synthase subunit HisF